MNIYARHLQQLGIRLPIATSNGIYQHYAGDLSVSDKGEILVWQPAT